MMHLSKKDLVTEEELCHLGDVYIVRASAEKKNTANLCLFTGSQALLKKRKETSNNEESGRSDRPRALSAAHEKHIKLISLQNQKMNWSSGRVAAKMPNRQHSSEATDKPKLFGCQLI